MVPTATPSQAAVELSGKITALRAEYTKLDADYQAELKASQAGGGLSPAQQAAWLGRYNGLKAQIQPLTEAFNALHVQDRVANDIKDLDAMLDGPAPRTTTLDKLGEDVADYRKQFMRGHGRGQQLRFFRPYGDSSENRLGNRQAALDAGLTIMAHGLGNGPDRDWALGRLRQRHGTEPHEFFATFPKRAEALGFNPFGPSGGEDTQAAGGYLVFPEFEAELINLKEQYGVLQQEAFKIPMGSDTKNIPRRAGGLTVYYPEENTQINPSQMAFDKVMLIARKYALLSLWSSELDEDSVIGWTDMLTGEGAYQLAKAEDFNGAMGDGTSTYAGVLGFLQALAAGKNGITPTGSLVTITAGNGWTTPNAMLKTAATPATTTQVLGFLNNLVAIVPVYAEGRAKLYCHKTFFWQFIAPVIEAAGGNIAMYLSSGIPLKFLGYDVKVMQAMPNYSTINGAGASNLQIGAVLGDMLYTCFMGQRRGVRVKTSDQRFIEYDQLAIQITQRTAINNVVGDAVRPTSDPGPMVGLQFPAT